MSETAPKYRSSHGFQRHHDSVSDDTWSDLWLVSSISLPEAMKLLYTDRLEANYINMYVMVHGIEHWN